MNRKLRKMFRRLEAAGAVVGIDQDVPDELAEMFLRSILDCLDCAAALEAREREMAETRRHPDGH